MRQTLYNLSIANDWLHKHKFMIGEWRDPWMQGNYGVHMASSVFCLVLAGDGWSARMEDAVLHGCIPVIIMDHVHVTYDTILEPSKYTVRIAQRDVNRTLEILKASHVRFMAAVRVGRHTCRRLRACGVRSRAPSWAASRGVVPPPLCGGRGRSRHVCTRLMRPLPDEATPSSRLAPNS